MCGTCPCFKRRQNKLSWIDYKSVGEGGAEPKTRKIPLSEPSVIMPKMVFTGRIRKLQQSVGRAKHGCEKLDMIQIVRSAVVRILQPNLKSANRLQNSLSAILTSPTTKLRKRLTLPIPLWEKSANRWKCKSGRMGARPPRTAHCLTTQILQKYRADDHLPFSTLTADTARDRGAGSW